MEWTVVIGAYRRKKKILQGAGNVKKQDYTENGQKGNYM